MSCQVESNAAKTVLIATENNSGNWFDTTADGCEHRDLVSGHRSTVQRMLGKFRRRPLRTARAASVPAGPAKQESSLSFRSTSVSLEPAWGLKGQDKGGKGPRNDADTLDQNGVPQDELPQMRSFLHEDTNGLADRREFLDNDAMSLSSPTSRRRENGRAKWWASRTKRILGRLSGDTVCRSKAYRLENKASIWHAQRTLDVSGKVCRQRSENLDASQFKSVLTCLEENSFRADAEEAAVVELQSKLHDVKGKMMVRMSVEKEINLPNQVPSANLATGLASADLSEHHKMMLRVTKTEGDLPFLLFDQDDDDNLNASPDWHSENGQACSEPGGKSTNSFSGSMATAVVVSPVQECTRLMLKAAGQLSSELL